MSEQQDRSVLYAQLRDRRRFVEDLPAAELDDEIVMQLGFREKGLECPHLHREQRLARSDDEKALWLQRQQTFVETERSLVDEAGKANASMTLSTTDRAYAG